MSKLNKYQGKTQLEISVSDWVIRNLSTGVETYMDTVQSESLTKSSSETKIKGGINNDTIATIAGDETIELEIVDAVARPELTGAKWGEVEKTGSIVKTEFPRNYIVESGKTVTLAQLPLNADDIVIYKGDKALEETTDYTISEKTITISNSGIKVGDALFITSYAYQAEEGAYSDVAEKASALSFELLQRKPIFDSNLQIIAYKVRHYGKATMSAEAEESGQAEREGQPITYKFSIEKNLNLPYVMRTYIEPVK